MKYVFFGTPEFAAIVLARLLAAGLPPIALVCNPDRSTGRKKVITSPPTKVLILQNAKECRIYQPEKPDAIFEESLRKLRPDIAIVAAYARILPASLLAVPRLGCIGIHPSLLPKLRGASPIQSAILNGEKETGVTLYGMDVGMDDGPIIMQERLPDYEPDTDSTETLLPRLAELGGTLAAGFLPEAAHRIARATPQHHDRATFTKKFRTDDAGISETDLAFAESGDNPELAHRLDRKIRAFHPEPGAWTLRNGKRIKLLDSARQNGKLILKKIQAEGKEAHAPVQSIR